MITKLRLVVGSSALLGSVQAVKLSLRTKMEARGTSASGAEGLALTAESDAFSMLAHGDPLGRLSSDPAVQKVQQLLADNGSHRVPNPRAVAETMADLARATAEEDATALVRAAPEEMDAFMEALVDKEVEKGLDAHGHAAEASSSADDFYNLRMPEAKPLDATAHSLYGATDPETLGAYVEELGVSTGDLNEARWQPAHNLHAAFEAAERVREVAGVAQAGKRNRPARKAIGSSGAGGRRPKAGGPQGRGQGLREIKKPSKLNLALMSNFTGFPSSGDESDDTAPVSGTSSPFDFGLMQSPAVLPLALPRASWARTPSPKLPVAMAIPYSKAGKDASGVEDLTKVPIDELLNAAVGDDVLMDLSFVHELDQVKSGAELAAVAAPKAKRQASLPSEVDIDVYLSALLGSEQ